LLYRGGEDLRAARLHFALAGDDCVYRAAFVRVLGGHKMNLRDVSIQSEWERFTKTVKPEMPPELRAGEEVAFYGGFMSCLKWIERAAQEAPPDEALRFYQQLQWEARGFLEAIDRACAERT